jgi:hypothetical protein
LAEINVSALIPAIPFRYKEKAEKVGGIVKLVGKV